MMRADISLDLYRIFCAVVRTGNMSRAAKELYISQPAVSMAVRQLEERMGGELLVRTARGSSKRQRISIFRCSTWKQGN